MRDVVKARSAVLIFCFWFSSLRRRSKIQKQRLLLPEEKKKDPEEY